jgi:phenylalanyl-tRNA synthetase beta chain
MLRRLTKMGFQWAPTSDTELEEIDGIDSPSTYWVFSPHWRTDINYDVDVIEEIARIIGYDKIPTEMMEHPLPGQETEPMIAFKKKIRQSLVDYGFQEIISYSMTSEEMLAKTKVGVSELKPPPLKLANPMTIDQQCLRTNIRAGLLKALEENRRYHEGSIRLFELGRVFIPKKNDLPYEPELLYAVISSAIGKKKWPADGKSCDFLDAKGAVEGLLAQLGVEASYRKASDNGLRPGYQADILVDDKKVGVVGEVHPKVAQAFGIDEPVYLLGVSLLPLLLKTADYSEYKSVILYPPVVRDIALVVGNEVNHQQVVDLTKDTSLLKDISLFDVYTGKQVPEGRKSLAYRLTFQSDEHTLTDEEVDKVQGEIIKKLAAELDASLRT